MPQTQPAAQTARAAVDALLATMNREFDAVYARRGRPSVPPEMLLKALLLQILFFHPQRAPVGRRSTTTCCTAGSWA